MASQENTKEMQSLFHTNSHEHSLELKDFHKPYICNGCKERGFGPRYRCEKCNFDLHKQCMFPEVLPTSHEFFPKSAFKFLETPPKSCHDDCKRQCDACRMPINGFVYHCKKRNLDLHPCCRDLKTKYQVKEEELVLEFNLHKKVKGECFLCNKKRITKGDRISGWSYISRCGSCHIHVACVTELLLEEWNNKRNRTNKMKDSDISLALQKMNLKQIQARRKGGSGNKVWKILKVLLSTIVSIVLGDPTTVFASLFLELLT